MITSSKKGFTLLELLIVIAIIAILSVVLIVALNPAETLRKTRDSQRISDLSSTKTALGIYVTTVTSPDLDAAISPGCLGTGVTDAVIFYSDNVADTNCATTISEGTDATGSFGDGVDTCRYASASALTDGTGWLPVNLSAIPGGSPISNMPVDPINSVATAATPISTDLVYRYACVNVGTSPDPSVVFELNAVLESAAFGVNGTDDKAAKDGGDNAVYYETGTSIRLMGAGTNY